MQIQINTDRNIEGHEVLAAQVTGVVESALSRLSDYITRVEVHLSDENSDTAMGWRPSMRASIMQRMSLPPFLDQAVSGAAGKLTRLIESTLGRLRDQESRRIDPPSSESKLREE